MNLITSKDTSILILSLSYGLNVSLYHIEHIHNVNLAWPKSILAHSRYLSMSNTPKASFSWFWENDVNSSKEKIAIKALIMTGKLDSWPKWNVYSISKPQRLLKAYFGLGLNDLLHTCFQKIENFQCPSK